MSDKMDVYLEAGEKRTFAGAIDWPGWCRSGRDEQTALQALFDYGPRYAKCLGGSRLGFSAPKKLSALRVIETLLGSTTTDFGAPDAAPKSDTRALDEAALRRLEGLLKACWRTFDAATRTAKGKALRSGPRGGGRDVEKMIEHVLGADEAYLSRLGWTFKRKEGELTAIQLEQVRDAALKGLEAAARGEIPAHGLRGGRRWSPRYFVRRVAWHALDHAWEIEDRLG